MGTQQATYRWAPRPMQARLIRVAVLVTPFAASILFVALVSKVVPALAQLVLAVFELVGGADWGSDFSVGCGRPGCTASVAACFAVQAFSCFP